MFGTNLNSIQKPEILQSIEHVHLIRDHPSINGNGELKLRSKKIGVLLYINFIKNIIEL
jgi:hypothetical protein